MPSPFPGMDPYLESRRFWPNLHLLLIGAANNLLQPILRPRGYLVALGERVWITQPGRPAYPDVAIVEHPRQRARDTGTAVLEADEPVKVRSLEVEVHEPFLEIIDAAGGKLVTGIEFLSPDNKASGGGRNRYLSKQKATLRAGANLVEVDFLRRGRYTVAAPTVLLESVASWDYLVCISRAESSGEYELYPIPLTERLPRIRVPLKPGDEDAVLDLGAVMNRAYDDGPFADRIDYSANPPGRLPADKLSWCKELLSKHRVG